MSDTDKPLHEPTRPVVVLNHRDGSQTVTADPVLLIMAQVCRAADSGGWARPPKEMRAQCAALVRAGLAEQSGRNYRPTAAGWGRVGMIDA